MEPGLTRSPSGLMASLVNGTINPNDTFQFERMLLKRGFRIIAGTDEVGRGPLAGPVVAASVILPVDCAYHRFRDSKQTSEKQRYQLKDLLHEIGAAIGVGIVSPATIDKMNILQASLLAMKRSIDELTRSQMTPDFILVDGRHTLPLTTPQEALIRGDAKSASIAAASIVAKIARDEIMVELHRHFPQYNFAANKGYPTREHRQSVAKHGPSPFHRLSFRGVKEFVSRADQPW
jgi:ribonuclease HII